MMKQVIMKYYNLDEETKELLPFLNVYHEMMVQADNYENQILENLNDEEIVMNAAIFCAMNTILDISEIIKRLFDVLNGQDIFTSDIDELSKEELFELLDISENEVREYSEETVETEDTQEIKPKIINFHITLDEI